MSKTPNIKLYKNLLMSYESQDIISMTLMLYHDPIDTEVLKSSLVIL